MLFDIIIQHTQAFMPIHAGQYNDDKYGYDTTSTSGSDYDYGQDYYQDYGQDYGQDTISILDDKREVDADTIGEMIKNQKIFANRELMLQNFKKLIENLTDCENYIN